MDEQAIRLVIVAGVLAVVGVAALSAKLTKPKRPLDDTGLAAGVYLFSSANCGECEKARSLIEQRLGGRGYIEVDWEAQPDLFDRLGIAEAPSTLIVANDGSGEWYPGVPVDVLSSGNP